MLPVAQQHLKAMELGYREQVEHDGTGVDSHEAQKGKHQLSGTAGRWGRAEGGGYEGICWGRGRET